MSTKAIPSETTKTMHSCVFCEIVKVTHPSWMQPGNVKPCCLCGRRFCVVHGALKADGSAATMCILHAEHPNGPVLHAHQATATMAMSGHGNGLMKSASSKIDHNAKKDAKLNGTEVADGTKNTRAASGINLASSKDTTSRADSAMISEKSTRKLEIWERPLDWNGDGGCCSHSNALEECRRASCCTHGLAKCAMAASNALRKGMRPMKKLSRTDIPSEDVDVDIPTIQITRAGKAPPPQQAPVMDKSMLVPGPTRFVPQLGCLAPVNGQQCILFRGFEPIPAPLEVQPHGLLVHLSAEMHLLVRANEDIVCVIVPPTGGVFTTRRGRKLALHPEYPVRPVETNRTSRCIEVVRHDVEVAGDEGMVKKLVAFYEWLSTQGTTSQAISLSTANALTKTPATNKLYQILGIHCGVVVANRRWLKYPWASRPINKTFKPLRDMLGGLCGLISGEITIPRLFVPYSAMKHLLVVDVATLPPLRHVQRSYAPWLRKMMDIELMRPKKHQIKHASTVTMSTQTTAVASLLSEEAELSLARTREDGLDGTSIRDDGLDHVGQTGSENMMDRVGGVTVPETRQGEAEDDSTTDSSLDKPAEEAGFWRKTKIGHGFRKTWRRASHFFHIGNAQM